MKRRKLIGLSVVMLLLSFSLYVSTFAQAPAAAPGTPPAAAGAPAKKGAFGTSIWDLWVVGGWAMYPLGICSVGALGLTIYGFLIASTDKMLKPELFSSVQASLENLNIEEASSTCAGNPCIMTNVLGAGLQRISHGELDISNMEKAMEEASIEESSSGLKPIGYLSIVAQVAPMIGLLGTVSGMIKAFQKIGMGGMGDPEKLASDIGEAMITTAFGLIVAIPAMFFYFYLKAKYIGNIARLSRMLGNLTHQLILATKRGQGQFSETSASTEQ